MLCVFVFVACFPFLRFLFVFPAGHAVTETVLRNDPDVNINGGRETARAPRGGGFVKVTRFRRFGNWK